MTDRVRRRSGPFDAVRYPLDRSPSLVWARICTDRAWEQPAWDLGRTFAAHADT